MKEFFSNKWTKLGISLISVIYAIFIISIAYSTFLYSLKIENKFGFTFTYIIINILFFVIMIFTRKQIFTSIVSMILLPFVFAILIFNFGNWLLIAPIFVVASIMFFSCKTNETVKTILGTVYLLLYILGLIAFFLIRFLFAGSSNETKLNEDIIQSDPIWQVYSSQVVYEATKDNISPDGKYRFYLLDVEDSSFGRVELYVEPNDKDKHHKFYTLSERGCERIVARTNSRGDKSIPKINWISSNRIQYQFGNEPAKETLLNVHKKDYFSFLY